MWGDISNRYMPQYELMYILSSNVPDNEEPALSDKIKKFIIDQGAEITKEEKLGKKRLAYPIKKTRNGFYVLFEFKAESDKLAEIEHKVRVTQGVIRYLIINLDEQLARMEKDREERKTFKPKPIMQTQTEKKTPVKRERKPEITIDLDKQIEQALEEDLTKNN